MASGVMRASCGVDPVVQGFDRRLHLLDQAARLVEDVVVIATERPQHEFGRAGRDEGLDPVHDGRSIAGDDAALGIALEARRVGLGHPLHQGLVPAAEAEGEARAVVVRVDAPPGLGERLLDPGDGGRHLLRRLQPGQPARADARRAPGSPACSSRRAREVAPPAPASARSSRPSSDRTRPRNRPSPRSRAGR